MVGGDANDDLAFDAARVLVCHKYRKSTLANVGRKPDSVCAFGSIYLSKRTFTDVSSD